MLASSPLAGLRRPDSVVFSSFLVLFFLSAGRTSFQHEPKRVEPEKERAARVHGAQSVFQAPLFICNAEVMEGDCGEMQRTSSAGEHPTT